MIRPFLCDVSFPPIHSHAHRKRGGGRTIGHLSQFLHSRLLKLTIRMNSHFHSESACLKDTADKSNGSGFLIFESNKKCFSVRIILF